MTAVNIDDIGAPPPPTPETQGVIPLLSEPIPIEPGGAPVELPSRVVPAPAPPPPAVEILRPAQPGLPPPMAAPVPLEPGAHAQAGSPSSHPEAHAVAVRARAHAAAAPPQDQHAGQVFVDQEEGGVARLQGTGDKDPFTAPLPVGAKEGMWIPDPRIAGNGPDDLMKPAPASIAPGPPATPATVADANVKAAEDKAAADAEAANLRAAETQKNFDEANRLQRQQSAAIAEAERRRDEARQKRQDFKVHEFWGKKGPIAALGLALGGDGGPGFRRRVDHDLVLQNAELAKRQEAEKNAEGDLDKLHQRHRDEWLDLKFKQAQGLDALAAKIDQTTAQSKGRVDINNAKMLAAEMRQKAAKIDLDAQHEIASTHLLKAQTAHAYAQASRERAANGAAKTDKAAAADDALLAKAVKEFDRQHGLSGEKGLGKRLDELGTAYSEATAATQNPLTQLTILDKIIRNATGLGVRGQVLQTYREHLGGLMARGEGKAQEWVNGTLGKQQWANVVNHIQGALGEARKEASEKNKVFQKVFKGPMALPAAKRRQETIGALETGLFGGMPGYGEQPGAATSVAQQRPQMIRRPNGEILRLQPDGTYR